MKSNHIASKIIIDGIDQIKSEIIKQSQSTIAGYLDSKSDELDKQIVEIERQEGLRFVAGEISLVLVDSDRCRIEVDFYFNDSSKNWKKRQIIGAAVKLEWVLHPGDEEILINERKVTYEYIRPKI